MLKDFREFALRGNVLDMAVGIIIGGAFGTIVQSLVNDVLMPILGLMLGQVDFGDLFLVLREGPQNLGPYISLEAAKAAGAVTLNYGQLINSVVSFLIVAVALFIVVKNFNRLKKISEHAPPSVPKTKKCPECLSEIPIEARRCSACTIKFE